MIESDDTKVQEESVETLDFNDQVKTETVGVSTKSLINRHFKKLAKSEQN